MPRGIKAGRRERKFIKFDSKEKIIEHVREHEKISFNMNTPPYYMALELVREGVLLEVQNTTRMSNLSKNFKKGSRFPE